MKTKKLRWGLLSTARINRAVIPPIRSSSRGDLTAVCSRTQERVQAYAQEWKIPRTFDSYEAMLADPDIDVIYNPLPNSMHTEWTIKAAQAGKHVLCEKPMALTVEEVDQMIAAAFQTGKVISEAFMYRHHPQTLKVKQLIEEGEIGELRMIKGAFSFFLDRPGDVRVDPDLGGGSIWDVGCYPISYTRFMVGAEPETVFGSQVTGSTGTDDTFAGQMRFPGDILAQFDCSFRVQHRTYMEIAGSKGTITIKRPFTPKHVESIELKQGDKVHKIIVRSGNLYAGEIEDMHDAILEGKSPRVSLQDSRGTVQAITALLRSARENRPVEISS